MSDLMDDRKKNFWNNYLVVLQDHRIPPPHAPDIFATANSFIRSYTAIRLKAHSRNTLSHYLGATIKNARLETWQKNQAIDAWFIRDRHSCGAQNHTLLKTMDCRFRGNDGGWGGSTLVQASCGSHHQKRSHPIGATSRVQRPASDFRLQTSDFRLHSSSGTGTRLSLKIILSQKQSIAPYAAMTRLGDQSIAPALNYGVTSVIFRSASSFGLPASRSNLQASGFKLLAPSFQRLPYNIHTLYSHHSRLFLKWYDSRIQVTTKTASGGCKHVQATLLDTVGPADVCFADSSRSGAYCFG